MQTFSGIIIMNYLNERNRVTYMHEQKNWFSVKLIASIVKLVQMKDWCKKNTQDFWSIEFTTENDSEVDIFRFKSKNDAVLFKLIMS